jgi:hypothetical protein
VPSASAVLLAADRRAIVPAQSTLVAVRRADDQGLNDGVPVRLDQRRFTRCVADLTRRATVTTDSASSFDVS